MATRVTAMTTFVAASQAHHESCSRRDTLAAGLDELKALFALHGRPLMTTIRRQF